MSKSDLLVVVDVQNGFVNDKSRHIVEPLRAFTERWVKGGGQVVATKFFNEPGSPWEELMRWSRLRKPPETDLHSAVRSLFEHSDQVRIFSKVTYSSLTEEVIDVVRAESVKRVFITGMDTDACVLKTAVDFFEFGVEPVVISDLCASSAGQELHEAGLLLIRRLIGRGQMVCSKSIL